MEIVAYGSRKAECKKCRESEKLIEEILSELGVTDSVTLRKLDLQAPEAALHGVMVTPTLVINDQIVADGKLPDREKLTSYLKGQLGL
jgi:predicted thioredoxin/glutaredoxin